MRRRSCFSRDVFSKKSWLRRVADVSAPAGNLSVETTASGGTNDKHACAVRQWVDDFVVGLNFCPWARPVREAGGIRLVTSAATTPDDVLQELAAEAKLLPRGDVAPGEASTTLLVCPNVAAWEDFDEFYIFFSEQLGEGMAFVEEFGLKIVAFHPRYSLYSEDMQPGDRVIVAGPDDSTVYGVVLDSEPEIHPDDGEEAIEIRFDDGREFYVRRRSILGVVSDSPDAGGDEHPSNLISRAPRPTLHLLRVEDLRKSGEQAEAGLGPDVQAVLGRNFERASELGIEGVDAILHRCG